MGPRFRLFALVMKILLYEPGTSGHRPVILRYTKKILKTEGIEWVHEKDIHICDSKRIIERAKNERCDVLYVLTLDGVVEAVWKLSRLASKNGIRTICTYYCFNNIVEGWKSLVWKVLLSTGRIDTIFVSDKNAKLPGWYPPSVRFLPDPWDPAEFPSWTQCEARTALNLNLKSCVFLMFGELNSRKGINTLLNASLKFAKRYSERNVIFLYAGNVEDEVVQKCREAFSQFPNNVSNFLHDGFVPEEKVSQYFYAADYIVVAYPRWFKVSSGSVTRALAAGRPLIVSDHGVNAELVRKTHCGYTFEAGSDDALMETLASATVERIMQPASWQKKCNISKAQSENRTLAVYGNYLLEGLCQDADKVRRNVIKE